MLLSALFPSGSLLSVGLEFVCKEKDTVFVYFLHPNNLDASSDLFGVFLCLQQFVIFYFHFLTTADQNKAIYPSSIEPKGVEW